MREVRRSPSPAVVVGIDGSRAAVAAALWAVDEAVQRDFPLRLVYAIEPRTPPADPSQGAKDLAAAEAAMREAAVAIESLDQPVKVEMEIVQAPPEQALISASRAAAMVCIGALGRDHAAGRRVGSVAAAVSKFTHCPVAIVRRHQPRQHAAGWVVAEITDSLDSNWVLESALAEARLRRAPLQVLAAWQPRFTDVHDPRAVADHDRLVRADLEKRLARYRRRYLELDVETVAVLGTTMNYIAEHAQSIQLVVLGQQRNVGLGDVAGPAGHAALHDTDCSVLICQRRDEL